MKKDHIHVWHYKDDGSDCKDCDLFDNSPEFMVCPIHQVNCYQSRGWYGVKYECHEGGNIHNIE